MKSSHLLPSTTLKAALRVRNWAIALSFLSTSLFLFPFITAVAFGSSKLSTLTIAAMLACAILQSLGFLIALYLAHNISGHTNAQRQWGCVQLLPGIDATLSICIFGAMAEFVAFIAFDCFSCSGGCCNTPIGPTLPAVLVGMGLSIMATVFISRLLTESQSDLMHLQTSQENVDLYFVSESKYGTLE